LDVNIRLDKVQTASLGSYVVINKGVFYQGFDARGAAWRSR